MFASRIRDWEEGSCPSYPPLPPPLLGASLSGKFVQFISGHRGQEPPFSSVRFILLSSRTRPALTRIDLAGLQNLLFQSSKFHGYT